MDEDTTTENLAATLARVLPQPQKLHWQPTPGEQEAITHLALPAGFKLQAIDNEPLLPGPRHLKLAAAFDTVESFIDYVNHHAPQNHGATVWCRFNPKDGKLGFDAVLDEHLTNETRWRKHRATFAPRHSLEWTTWTSHDKQTKEQVAFAEFLEANERDIAAGDKLPSSLDMLKMATEFEAHAEKRLKSVVRLQGGGVRLEYVNTDNDQTIEQMRMFEKFQIAVPVFWTMPKAGEPVAAYPVLARLKYRQAAGAVKFWYELIRPDLVYQTAAMGLIEQVRAGIGAVPLRMGAAE